MATVKENITNALTWFYERLKSNDLDPLQDQIDELNTNIDNKAPTSHASSDTTYGVGTSSNYGHCRTINNLTTSSNTNGYALSAYQGYVLNQSLNKLPAQIEAGSISGVSVSGNSYTDSSVKFSTSFSGNPYIILSMSGNNTGTGYANIALTTTDRSSTGFTLRMINNNSGSYSVSAHWIAVYN